MKVLITGGDYTWSIEKHYISHLNEISGTEIELFPAQNIFYDYLGKGISKKIIHRLGWSSIYRTINQLLIQKIDQFQPQVLWVFKGMEIFPSTLTYAKIKGIRLINYNPDNPFIFTGRGSGNKFVTDSLQLFDLYITYSLEIFNDLVKKGLKAQILPFAYSLPEELTVTLLNSVDEINKACFIGNPDSERAKFINALAERGVTIDVFGNNWAKFTSNSNVTINAPIYGTELWLTLRRYRVQLNMLRVHNLTSHNMRSFEIPGVGGIQLAPNTIDHASFFEAGKSIFLYNTVEEAAFLIEHLLSLSSKAALEIRNCTFSHCANNGYDYKNRSQQVYTYFQELI